MKVFVAFTYFFLSVLIPVGLGFLGVVLAPDKLVADRQMIQSLKKDSDGLEGVLTDAVSRERLSYPGALAGAIGRYERGVVRLLVCRDKEQAKALFKSYSQKAAEGAGAHQTSGPNYHSYTIPGTRIAGRIELIDEAILHAEASAAETAEELIRHSGIVRPNPKANWMTEVFRTPKHFLLVTLSVLVYAAVQLPIWNRVGSWAAKIGPRPGIIAVSEAELRRRLLSINDSDVPFQVIEKKGGTLEAVWRLADAKWAGLASLNKVRELRVIQLRLHEGSKICRALDIGKSVKATADGLELGFSLSGFFFRGIIFTQWEYEVQYGITFSDGTVRFGKAYEYRFDHDELQKPIVETIIGSGWEYRPVLFLSRILGG